MATTPKQIALISVTIWVTAVVVNTALGLYTIGDKVKVKSTELALTGLTYGAIFSLPIFLVIWAALYYMHKKKFKAGNIYLILLSISMAMVLGSFYLFSGYMQLSATYNIPLGGCAIIAALAAILPQYTRLKKVCFQRDRHGHF